MAGPIRRESSALNAEAVWAATSRELTGFSADEIFDLPIYDDIGGVFVASAASADAFGSWAEIAADIGVGKRLMGFNLIHAGAINIDNITMEIGTGGLGAESAVARGRYNQRASAEIGMSFLVGVSLADNARLSCRAKDASGDARFTAVAVHVS